MSTLKLSYVDVDNLDHIPKACLVFGQVVNEDSIVSLILF